MLNVVHSMICKDSLILAKWVVEQIARGRVRGIGVALRLSDGHDEVVFAGLHRRRAEVAVAAASRMYWIASRQVDVAERSDR